VPTKFDLLMLIYVTVGNLMTSLNEMSRRLVIRDRCTTTPIHMSPSDCLSLQAHRSFLQR